MSHNNQKGFIAENADLEFYNGKALLNLIFSFYFMSDDCPPVETEFGFDGYVSAYFRVSNEREGVLLKNYTTQISRDDFNLVMNCSESDMTFAELGDYHFELGYLNSGYEVPLRYGKLKII